MKASLLIHPDELDEIWIDEAVRCGVSTIGLHPVGGKKASESMADLMQLMETEEFRRKADAVIDAGLELEYEMHTARYLLPEDQFAAHPEWFRVNTDGVRSPDFNCCATNEEALNYMAGRAASVAKKLYRSSHRFYFWMDDVTDCTCHCEKCSRYTPSDQQMLVMNALLKGIRREIPDAELAFLAYLDFKNPPVTVRPEEGIFLEYAPIDRDFHRPVNDPDSAQNGKLIGIPEALLEYFGREKSKVLEYWLDNSLFSKWTKPPRPFTPDAPVIQADTAYYRGLGFEELSTFACYLGPDYRALYGMPDIAPFAGAIKASDK